VFHFHHTSASTFRFYNRPSPVNTQPGFSRQSPKIKFRVAGEGTTRSANGMPQRSPLAMARRHTKKGSQSSQSSKQRTADVSCYPFPTFEDNPVATTTAALGMGSACAPCPGKIEGPGGSRELPAVARFSQGAAASFSAAAGDERRNNQPTGRGQDLSALPPGRGPAPRLHHLVV
jgi:hypothetical protein